MSKLDWMYKSTNSVDPEDYLLGKAIDKNFEAQGSSKNEVDKDILPTSIFANANSAAPVDIFRKIKEDPLEQIKQKEIEMRKQLLKNPVKLKKLQSMLKAKADESEQKKKKKNKTKDIDNRIAKLMQKYGTKKVMDLAVSDDSEDEEASGKSRERSRVGKKIKKRYDSSPSSDDKDVQICGDSKDRYSMYEEKKRQSKKRRSRSVSRDRGKSRKSTHSEDRHSRDVRRRHRPGSPDGESSEPKLRKGKSSKGESDVEGLMDEYMRLIEKHGAKKLMELISEDSDEDESKKKKKMKKFKRRSDSTSDSDSHSASKSINRKKQSAKKRRSLSEDGSSSGDEKTQKKKGSKKSKHGEVRRKPIHRSPSSSSSSPDDDDEGTGNVQSKVGTNRHDRYSSDEGKSSFSRAYGLVLPKGVGAKPKSSPQPSTESTSKKVDDPKTKFVRHRPSRLTDEEKAARLKEMMANAQWRDKERKSNVTKYREEEKREVESQQYDEGFMRKELAKAVDSSKSVEERIKSRMNNVQRSKFSMSQNFARRN